MTTRQDHKSDISLFQTLESIILDKTKNLILGPSLTNCSCSIFFSREPRAQ